MADTAITPPTGTLAFTGEDTYFINSGDCKLVFTGYAPVVLLADTVVNPGTGSLGFSAEAPIRPIGLTFTGFAPTLKTFDIIPVPTGSLSFTGKTPQRIVSTPPNIIVSPDTGSIGFTGYTSSLFVQTTILATDSLTFTGFAPNALIAGITTPKFPFYGILTMTGYAPTLKIEGVGTPITNVWATTDVPTNYQIDDRTGFKIKVKDPMVKDYTGHYMRPESVDIRSEQEFLKSKPERHRGPLRPEPQSGDEDFVEDSYPDGVTPDDL